MTLYKMAQGFDVPLVDLDALVPQPRSEGVKPLQVTYGGDNTVFHKGQYIELFWDLTSNQSMYQTLIIAFFTVSYLLSNEITIFCPSPQFQFQRYNGIAVMPENGRDVRRRDYFIRDITILIKDLALSS